MRRGINLDDYHNMCEQFLIAAAHYYIFDQDSPVYKKNAYGEIRTKLNVNEVLEGIHGLARIFTIGSLRKNFERAKGERDCSLANEVVGLMLEKDSPVNELSNLLPKEMARVSVGDFARTQGHNNLANAIQKTLRYSS